MAANASRLLLLEKYCASSFTITAFEAFTEAAEDVRGFRQGLLPLSEQNSQFRVITFRRSFKEIEPKGYGEFTSLIPLEQGEQHIIGLRIPMSGEPTQRPAARTKTTLFENGGLLYHCARGLLR